MHRSGATTLVIVDTVRRAQAVYRAFADIFVASTAGCWSIPATGRRTGARWNSGCATAPRDRVVVATQAVEAGVDMTSAVLFTELGPWSSLVQRFGRCNRAGELNALSGAEIRWIDVETDGDGATARPYATEGLRAARDILATLDEVSPRDLPPPSRPAFPDQVIRPKDFEELFDTDADLSGYDLDVSPYIRDGDDLSISLFWLAIGNGADEHVAAERPRRDELCAAPLGKELEAWLKPRGRTAPVYVEDPLASGEKHWIRFDRSGRRLRPGLTLLLDVSMGGYDPALGFVGAASTAPVEPVAAAPSAAGNDADLGDPQSGGVPLPVSLVAHLDDVAAAA